LQKPAAAARRPEFPEHPDDILVLDPRWFLRARPPTIRGNYHRIDATHGYYIDKYLNTEPSMSSPVSK
jgi:hypothetical protein